jgi:hypothetical protein
VKKGIHGSLDLGAIIGGEGGGAVEEVGREEEGHAIFPSAYVIRNVFV